MALTLVMEPWTGAEPTANAYSDVATADAYLERHLWDTDDWDAATTPEKEQALVWTTELLDIHFLWPGVPLVTGQPLGLPTDGSDRFARLVTSDLVRQLVQRANAEFARHMLIRDRTIEHPTRGYDEMEAGRGGSLTMNPADRTVTVPDSVIFMLRPIASLAVESAGGFQQHRLIRA